MSARMCGKAGNAGDVLKHSVMTALLSSISGHTGLLVVETHSGPGRCAFVLGSKDHERGHLSTQPVPGGWTDPYVQGLNSLLHVGISGNVTSCSYPGSPMQILARLENRNARADCLFFENDPVAHASLLQVLAGKSVSGVHIHVPPAPQGFHVALPGQNPFAALLGAGQSNTEMGFMQLDPWYYAGGSVADGGLGLSDLTDAVQWLKQLVDDGIVAVWTARQVQADTRKDLGAALHADMKQIVDPNAMEFFITKRAGKGKYAYCVGGLGPLGRGVISALTAKATRNAHGLHEMPATGLLGAWGFHVRFLP